MTASSICRIVLAVLSAAVLPPSTDGAEPSGAVAEQVFARIRSLSGNWVGKSSEGWEGRLDIRPIARDSAVVSTSRFEAHPGETMLTVYHLDRDRLLLTHYCVAKNQPRLVLTAWDAGTARATFEYLDGTGLASRDQGHMDRVVLRFVDEGHITSRWTWYQDGSERWLEEISYRRTD